MDGNKARSLQEHPVYSAQVENLGGAKRVDKAIDLLLNAIARKPEDWPLVPGFTTIRLAKTIGAKWQLGPAGIKIWYRIVDDDNVELLYIAPNEDS